MRADNARSIGNHLRYCKGEQPQPVDSQNKCPHCDFIAADAGGLNVHKARKHPAERSSEIPDVKIRKWTPLEMREVAIAEIKGKAQRVKFINQHIAEQVSRPVMSIANLRKRAAYREILEGITAEEEEEVVPLEQVLDEISPDSPVLVEDEPVNRNDFHELEVRYLEDPSEENWGRLIVMYQDEPSRPPRRGGTHRRSTQWVSTRRKKQQKYAQFKKLQQAFSKNKGETVKHILKGIYDPPPERKTPDIPTVEGYFMEKLGSRVEDKEPPGSSQSRFNMNIDWKRKATAAEVRVLLKTYLKTSAGPDRVSLSTIKSINPQFIAEVFNIWRSSVDIPKAALDSRTVLIYKKGQEHLIENWRPITIGSLWARLYAKWLDKRFREGTTVHERQKAFVPLDGCYENSKIIQHIMKVNKNLCMVFIDLSKAFDTVRHDSIWRALKRKHVPSEMINWVKKLYINTYTKIVTSTGMTESIPILQGVKQGCPLSPLLFNLVLDELLEINNKLPCGIPVGESKVNTLAFANDTVLLTKTIGEMKILIQKTEDFFSRRGLKVNPAKCQSLWRESCRKRIKYHVEPHLKWNGEDIPAISNDSLVKYLGINYDLKGPLSTINVEEELSNIKNSPLKPHQKIEAIKSYWWPKIFFRLRLSQVGITKLRGVDRRVRVYFRKILHHPEWAVSDWIHHRRGGGVPEFTTRVVTSRYRAALKMITSSDPVASTIGKEMLRLSKIEIKRLHLDPNDMDGWEKTLEKQSEARISKMVDGKGINLRLKSKRPYLWNGALKGKQLINSAKILNNSLPNKFNLKRSKKNTDLMCRRCKSEMESTIHILNGCAVNSTKYSHRHNSLAKKIGRELTKKDYKVWLERSWNAEGETLRPDISAAKGGTLYTIDVTIPYLSSDNILQERAKEKRDKYKKIKLRHLPAEFVNENKIKKVEHHGYVISSDGTKDKNCKPLEKKLGISLGWQAELQVLASSAWIAAWHLDTG